MSELINSKLKYKKELYERFISDLSILLKEIKNSIKDYDQNFSKIKENLVALSELVKSDDETFSKKYVFNIHRIAENDKKLVRIFSGAYPGYYFDYLFTNIAIDLIEPQMRDKALDLRIKINSPYHFLRFSLSYPLKLEQLARYDVDLAFRCRKYCEEKLIEYFLEHA
jgi:hypothetical protein